jgi:hypothetical protein
LWHEAQSATFVSSSACIVWQLEQSVVPCSWISAIARWGRAWQPLHVEDAFFGLNEWHWRQSIFVASGVVGCACANCLSWQRAQGALPGFLKPSRS